MMIFYQINICSISFQFKKNYFTGVELVFFSIMNKIKKTKKTKIEKKNFIILNCTLLGSTAKFFKCLITAKLLLFDKSLTIFIHLKFCDDNIAWVDWNKNSFIVDLLLCN